jgi:GTP pyrophosphokinase
MPKANQYQSLHTTVIGPRREKMEVQIRTKEMHTIAEEGIAAHWSYKETGKIKTTDIENFAWLRQLLEWQKELDDPSEFLESMKVELFPDEVYVFTPKGDVKVLPKGATPVDFAYSIHTDIGHHCAGAKVNGKIVPLRYQLKSGDTVEIITSQKNLPSKDWLKFVKTSRAKTKIREFLKKQERERSQTLGYEILHKELSKFGSQYAKYYKDPELRRVAQEFNYNDLKKFYSAIAYGKIKIPQVLKKILPKEAFTENIPQQESIIEKFFKSAIKRSPEGIKVKGVDDVFVRFAKCCMPIPTEPVVGFITRGRGVTVHSQDCPHIHELDPERKIDVEWNTDKTSLYSVMLKITSEDRPGMLASISQTISSQDINIQKADVRTTHNNRAVGTFYIEVHGQEQLNNLIRAIEKVDGVYSVERVRG